jgi:hypothetical protein
MRTRRGFRRPGVGDGLDGNGYYGYGGVANEEYGSGGGRSGGYIPLLGRNTGRRSPGFAYSAFPTSGGYRNIMSTAYATTLRQQKSVIDTIGIHDRLDTGSSYLEWVPRDYGQAGTLSSDTNRDVLYQPVVSSTSPSAKNSEEPRQSLSQLVNNHLMAMRQSYTAQGWRAFQDGEYQTAIRMFSLAENAALDIPAERAYLKMVMVYSGIAAGQYAQVSNSLMWLLDQDSQTGRFRHVEAFNRIFDDNKIKTIGELYEKPGGSARPAGYQNPVYSAHNKAIENAVSQDQAALIPKGLLAIVDWGRGRRSDAILTAKKIPATAGRLALLGSLLEEADRLHKAEATGRTPPLAAPLSEFAIPTTTQPGL